MQRVACAVSFTGSSRRLRERCRATSFSSALTSFLALCWRRRGRPKTTSVSVRCIYIYIFCGNILTCIERLCCANRRFEDGFVRRTWWRFVLDKHISGRCCQIASANRLTERTCQTELSPSASHHFQDGRYRQALLRPGAHSRPLVSCHRSTFCSRVTVREVFAPTSSRFVVNYSYSKNDERWTKLLSCIDFLE